MFADTFLAPENYCYRKTETTEGQETFANNRLKHFDAERPRMLEAHLAIA